MFRMLAILALIAAMLVPHGTHDRGHVSAETHAIHDHARHSAMHGADHYAPCDTEVCGDGLLLSCCDAMPGHCFMAVAGGCADASSAVVATESAFAGTSAEMRVGLTVGHEPPPPRL